jgi:cation transport ATPase
MSKNPKLRKNGGEGTKVGNFLRSIVKSGKKVGSGLLSAAASLTGINEIPAIAKLINEDQFLSPEDKALALEQLELDKLEMKEVTERHKNDMSSDSWMSKNIRPLTLAFLLAVMFVLAMLDSTFDGFVVKDSWIDMLSTLLFTAVTFYYGARTTEKIVELVKNFKRPRVLEKKV